MQGAGYWESGYVSALEVVSEGSGYKKGQLKIQGHGGQGFSGSYLVCNSAGAVVDEAIGNEGNYMCHVSIDQVGQDYTSAGVLVIEPDEDPESGASLGTIYFDIDFRLTLYPSSQYSGSLSPGQAFTFSFEIINPNMAQDSPAVSISATGLSTVSMNRDPDAPCCASCTAEGVAMAGDAMPLQIADPLFCAKTITQSSDFPCVQNGNECLASVPALIRMQA